MFLVAAGAFLCWHSRAREIIVRWGKERERGGELVLRAHRRRGSSGWPESGRQRAAFGILAVVCSWMVLLAALLVVACRGRAASGRADGDAGPHVTAAGWGAGLDVTRRAAAMLTPGKGADTAGQGRRH